MGYGVNMLAQTIADAIKTAKKQGNTYQARIIGNAVIVNGSTIPFVAAIDTLTDDGDYVWVMLNDEKTLAVVVGK